MSKRVFDSEIAVVLGEKAAMLIGQLHYWTSKGMGHKDGDKIYIFNTYADWRSKENFPWWSRSTVIDTFNKLLEVGVVFKRHGNGYNRRCEYALNYKHELLASSQNQVVGKSNDQSYGNQTTIVRNPDDVINTNTTAKTTKSLQRKASPSTQDSTSTSGYKDTSKPIPSFENQTTPTSKGDYKEEYPEARKWLNKQSKDFRHKMNEWVQSEMASRIGKIKSPVAYEKAMKVDVWRKYTDQEHNCNFEYIDYANIQPSNVAAITVKPRVRVDSGFEEEMTRRYKEEHGD